MRIFTLVLGLIWSLTLLASEQEDFKVDIPDSWKLAHYSEEERLWVYQSDDGEHQLSVSILYYSQEPTHEQQAQFLDDFLKARREWTSQAIARTEFSEVELTKYNSAWVAKFSEISGNGRFAVNKAISTKVGIANFYFESFSARQVHEEISDKILSTTGFAS
jgi:hypothetical protein